MPQNVPKEFYDRIRMFHGHPFVWWIGQFTKYVFKYSKPIDELVKKKEKSLGFTDSDSSPIVGYVLFPTTTLNSTGGWLAVSKSKLCFGRILFFCRINGNCLLLIYVIYVSTDSFFVELSGVKILLLVITPRKIYRLGV